MAIKPSLLSLRTPLSPLKLKSPVRANYQRAAIMRGSERLAIGKLPCYTSRLHTQQSVALKSLFSLTWM